MAFHISQGHPNPLVLARDETKSFTIEVYADTPVGPGETIRVKLPEGLIFPSTGQVRYIRGGVNEGVDGLSREDGGRLVRFKAKAIGTQPEGFYSVNVQALPNAEDRPPLPDGLTIGASTTAQLSFRISPPQPVEHTVHGTVDANRNILSGVGFTVMPGLTGVCRIIFTKAFVSPPTVVATLRNGGERGTISVETVDTGLFTVRTATNGAWAPLGFSFVAIGVAAPNP
ncbi:hypothetical protein [Streptomyces sp. NPDC049555]|uniref:hypothetical protein n=1 Tax=Streptomyces sp. NPDC049555 TaxID=3154930 RepID=UPI003416B53A